MSGQSAGVYSDRDDLIGRLRETCPSWTFATDGAARDAARVAIIDGHSERPAGKSVVRLILGDGAQEHDRRKGELRIARDEFLRTPAEYLAFANDLADAAIHAAQLEQEAGYLRQIHELMTMNDAEAVS